MKIDFINSSYRRFFEAHEDEIMSAIRRCLAEGNFVLREDVEEFEKKLADFCGTKYAIGVNSGTDALKLSLEALGIGPGDEVITPSHTFIASIQEIIHVGAVPILIDVKDDALIDVDQIESLITEKTKAIMPIHLSGKVCDMTKIMEVADKYGLFVIEDACQALGATWDGKQAGSIGNTGCFSFISPKILGGIGDGGGIVTDSEEVYERCLLLRNHWNITQNALIGHQPKAPRVMNWGHNTRLDNVAAAYLNVKFKYYPWIMERRKEIADMYDEGLKDLPLKTPTRQEGQVHQEYIVQVDDQDKFNTHMTLNGVELLIRDTTPNHLLRGLGLDHFELPVTESMATSVVRLPTYPELTDEEIKYIIQSIKSYYEEPTEWDDH